MRRLISLCVASAVVAGVVLSGPLPVVEAAGLTAAHKKDLGEINKDLLRVPGLIKKKDIEDAEKILSDAEATLKKIASEAGLKPDDKAISSVQQRIDIQKKLLLKQKVEAGGIAVSFAKEVAPILTQKCTRCHGENNPAGELQLTTFAGMKKGGQSGAVLTIGDPDKSLIMSRVKATGNDRMPRGGQPLTAKEIDTLSTWIVAGAKFDGMDENASIAAGGAGPVKKEAVVIAKPTGSETVSFTKDIAPFMVNLCVRCHAGTNARSGFSLETFEKLMQGGNSGRVVIPGNLDGSRLWDLVGKQDPIKMPPGQLLITRTNHRKLQTWIEEGAKFDGSDPKLPLRQLVPTEEELMAAELAKLTPEELAAKHLERANELWKQVAGREEPKIVQGKEFIVIGNVSETRLEQVNKWAEEDAKTLRSLFGDRGEQLWKGKLTIFVMKDRFGYEEFNTVVNRREAPREVSGHSVVSASMEDVYIVLQDVGDVVTSESGGLPLNLKDHLTGAYLKRQSGRLPDWVLRGTGIAVAARSDPNNEYIRQLRGEVGDSLKVLERPEDVFSDGQFSPSTIAGVGYTLVEFLLKGGGGPKFNQFVKSVQGGKAVPAALQETYGSDAKSLALQYGAAIGSAKPVPAAVKKKK